MFNDIIVSDNVLTCARLFIIIECFSKIWQNINNTINILSFQWMFISTISDAKFFAIKIYSFNSKNKKILNKKYSYLYKKEKMSWIEKLTIYVYLIIII